MCILAGVDKGKRSMLEFSQFVEMFRKIFGVELDWGSSFIHTRFKRMIDHEIFNNKGLLCFDENVKKVTIIIFILFYLV